MFFMKKKNSLLKTSKNDLLPSIEAHLRKECSKKLQAFVKLDNNDWPV